MVLSFPALGSTTPDLCRQMVNSEWQVIMIMTNGKKYNIWKKIIAIGVVCLFLANQLAFAYPADTLAPPTGLANPNVRQEIIDRMDGKSEEPGKVADSNQAQPRRPDGIFGEKPGGSVEDVVRTAYENFGENWCTSRQLNVLISDSIGVVSLSTTQRDIRNAINEGRYFQRGEGDNYGRVRLTRSGRALAERLGAKVPRPAPVAVPVQAEAFYDRGRRTPQQQAADRQRLLALLDASAPLAATSTLSYFEGRLRAFSRDNQLSYHSRYEDERAAIAYWDLRNDPALRAHANNPVPLMSERPHAVVTQDNRHMRSILGAIAFGRIDVEELARRAGMDPELVRGIIYKHPSGSIYQHPALAIKTRTVRNQAELGRIHGSMIEMLEALPAGQTLTVDAVASKVSQETGIAVRPDEIRTVHTRRTFPQGKIAMVNERLDRGEPAVPKVVSPEATQRKDLIVEMLTPADHNLTAKEVVQRLPEGLRVDPTTVWHIVKGTGVRPKGTYRRNTRELEAHREILRSIITERKIDNQPCNFAYFPLLAERVNEVLEDPQYRDLRPVTASQVEDDLREGTGGLRDLRPLPTGEPYRIRTASGEERHLTFHDIRTARPSQVLDIVHGIAGGGLFSIEEAELIRHDVRGWQTGDVVSDSAKALSLPSIESDSPEDLENLRNLRERAWVKIRHYMCPLTLEDLGEVAQRLTPRQQAVVRWHLDPLIWWTDEVKMQRLSEIPARGEHLMPDVHGEELRPEVTPELLRHLEYTAHAILRNVLMPERHDLWAPFFGHGNAVHPRTKIMTAEMSRASDPTCEIGDRIKDAFCVDGATTVAEIRAKFGDDVSRNVVEARLRMRKSDPVLQAINTRLVRKAAPARITSFQRTQVLGQLLVMRQEAIKAGNPDRRFTAQEVCNQVNQVSGMNMKVSTVGDILRAQAQKSQKVADALVGRRPMTRNIQADRQDIVDLVASVRAGETPGVQCPLAVRQIAELISEKYQLEEPVPTHQVQTDVNALIRNKQLIEGEDVVMQRRTGKGQPANLLSVTESGWTTIDELARRADLEPSTAKKDADVLYLAGVLERRREEEAYEYRKSTEVDDERIDLAQAYLDDLFDGSNPRNKGNITRYREGSGRGELIAGVRENFVELRTLPREKRGVRSAQSIYNADAKLAGKVISQVKRLRSVGKHFEHAPRTYIFTINEHDKKTTPRQREEAKRQAEAMANSMGVELIIRRTTRQEDPTFTFKCLDAKKRTIGTTLINQDAYEESFNRTSNILALGFAASAVPHNLAELIEKKIVETNDYKPLLSHINKLYRSVDILERNLIDITDLQVAPNLITDILHNRTINIILPPVERKDFEQLDEFEMQYRALEKFA